MLLCDYAEQINGKLYVMGGGWSQILRPNEPTNMALAIKILVPWDQTNTPHKVTTALITEDGEPVIHNGEELKVEAGLEVGRPVGIKKGSMLDAPMAVNMVGIVLDSGSYEWQLSIDDELITRAAFTVAGGGN